MKEKLTLEMNVDEYLEPVFYLDMDPEDEASDYYKLDSSSKEEIAKKFKIPVVLLDSMLMFAADVGEALKATKRDMTDLYKEIKAIKETN